MKLERTFILIPLLCLLCALFPGCKIAAAETPAAEASGETTAASQKSKTSVTGLETKVLVSANASLRDVISVKPAFGRTINLQKYSYSEKEWKTIERYTAGPEETANVKLVFPSEYWNRSKFTKWRVYIPATKEEAAYTSKTVVVITQNRETLQLSCKSAVVMNAKTGNVLYYKNPDKKLPQASLTKIMTCILALEKNSLQTKVSISQNAANTKWSYITLVKGDKIYLKDLLYAALLRSSNGCAVALAEQTGKSVSNFAKMMNKKASELGCKNTHFVNPHGLDAEKHYSTAYDLALMTRYAWKNSAIIRIPPEFRTEGPESGGFCFLMVLL